MPYLQEVNGKFRVRIVVPEEVRPHLPPPHTGKESLTKALGTANEREANRLAVPHIAEFLGLIQRTADRTQALGDLAVIDGLPFAQQICRAPAAWHRLITAESAGPGE